MLPSLKQARHKT